VVAIESFGESNQVFTVKHEIDAVKFEDEEVIIELVE